MEIEREREGPTMAIIDDDGDADADQPMDFSPEENYFFSRSMLK